MTGIVGYDIQYSYDFVVFCCVGPLALPKKDKIDPQKVTGQKVTKLLGQKVTGQKVTKLLGQKVTGQKVTTYIFA
jgi:hypothetical protein